MATAPRAGQPPVRPRPRSPSGAAWRTSSSPRRRLLLAPAGPVEWPGTFFPYQLEGIRALLARRDAAAGRRHGPGQDRPGDRGAAHPGRSRGRSSRALLVAPAEPARPVARALRLWAPELRLSTVRGAAGGARLAVAGAGPRLPGQLRDAAGGLRARTPTPPPPPAWDLVVLDEAQQIKNRGVRDRSRVCKRLRRRRAWALTGTPAGEQPRTTSPSVLEFVTRPPEGDPRPASPSGSGLLQPARAPSSCAAARRTSCPSCRPRLVSRDRSSR